ncbi:MAG: MaoC family dehydratase N-terminal domain-containing protein [Dehalococcoidales bacterium]|nr:MaoC family dehydratase N-terminal domain-containing protein [Dehalococcoidales bacterium]
MAKESMLTDEMKKLIGVESEPSVFEIEKEPIRRWADAIGDANLLYHDEAYAKKCGYRSIIAPPGFMANYAFPVKHGAGVKLPPVGDKVRGLNGGNEFEFLKPIQAGDTITETSKVINMYEREGKLGIMLFIIVEDTFKNQKGETVAKARHTGIRY